MVFPKDFVDRIKEDLGLQADDFLKALQLQPEVSVRVNQRKFPMPENGDLVKWCDSAFYLENRPVFTMDPLFHSGVYYVQEASSMFVEQAFRQYAPANPVVMDLCAAPGGKTTHLISMVDGNGLVICNEVVGQRVCALRENVTKWGYPNVVVTSSDPSKFSGLEGLVDFLLVDAPCSGEGMFRKDEVAVSEWSNENVELCQKRQRKILSDIFPVLKTGGILVYSTCTYNKKEDEENVRWICEELGAEVLKLNVDESWNITNNQYGYHFYQHLNRGEGFFLCVLRKNAETGGVRIKSAKGAKNSPLPAVCKNWIIDISNYSFLQRAAGVVAFPDAYVDILNTLDSNVKVVQAGTLVCTVKGKDVLPAPELALSVIMNRKNFSSYNLHWNEAISFLKREALCLSSCEKGWILVCFRNVPLGWCKNLGNRSNNTYPAEWHVRMAADETQYTPIL